MGLVTDTWGANLNPAGKPFKMYKTLNATAVSGSAVTDTEAIFTKDCPFDVKVVAFEVQVVSLVASGFAGAGAALTVALQTSNEVDDSPTSPTTVVWDNAVSVNVAGSASDTDKLLVSAPSNASGVVNASLDQTWTAVPKGGSLRTTLSAQANNALGVGFSTPVELLAIVTCVPTATRDKRYF